MARMSKREREAREAEMRAYNERIARLEAIYAALPACPEVEEFKKIVWARITELYDEFKFAEGDVLLEFLPQTEAKALLDEYFGDDE